MNNYFGAFFVCSLLLQGVFCVYEGPEVTQHQQKPERPAGGSIFDLFSSFSDPPTSVIEVPFRGFQQRWRGLESMMRFLDSQMNDMMTEMESFIPIDREREEWCVSHPFVTESNGTEIFRITLDMRQFKPEEISIKVRDNVLHVDAKQESKTSFGTVSRQYRRQFDLPEGVNVTALRSTLSPEGVLTITAPLVEDEEPEEAEEEEGKTEEDEGQEEEGAAEDEESKEPEESPMTTVPSFLPELPAEHLPESEREKKEEMINIIHE